MKKIILFALVLTLVLPTITLAQDNAKIGRWCFWNCAKKGMSFGYHKYPEVNPFNLPTSEEKSVIETKINTQPEITAEIKPQEKKIDLGVVVEKNKTENNDEIVKLKKEIDELKKQQIVIDKKVEKNIQIKTNDQICNDYYLNSKGVLDDNGNLACDCKSDYNWNTERTTCVRKQPITTTPITTTPTTNITLCNGVSYSPCPTGQTFSCPASGKAQCLLPELTLAEEESEGFAYADKKGWDHVTIPYKGEKINYIKKNGVWDREDVGEELIQIYKKLYAEQSNEIKNSINEIEAQKKELDDKKQAEIDSINNNPWLSDNQRLSSLRRIDNKYDSRYSNLLGVPSSPSPQVWNSYPDGIGGYSITNGSQVWTTRPNGMGGWTMY